MALEAEQPTDAAEFRLFYVFGLTAGVCSLWLLIYR